MKQKISNVLKHVKAQLAFGTTKSSISVFLLYTVFFMLFCNREFYTVLLADYPFSADNMLFLFTALVAFSCVILLTLLLLCFAYTAKPIMIFLLMGGAFAAYFMDQYHMLIDRIIIAASLDTDKREARDLLSVTMLMYAFFLGILPSVWLWKTKIQYRPFQRELLLRGKWLAGMLIVLAVLFFAQSAMITSFLREHKPVRFRFNPANYVSAIISHVKHTVRESQMGPVTVVAADAAIDPKDTDRELIIFIVGETARADHFSLNGYERETNPLLAKQPIVSFKDVKSCATLTALSLPCMFSNMGTDIFNVNTARQHENLLDILQRAGVAVLWRDNNSSSKSVADRVPYEDYRDPDKNPICDPECRDVGMLDGLKEYITSRKEKDIIIVLHQMGNHGPAYFKRYPDQFERFKPACKTNELSECSDEQIINAYDNAILYTDYFLNEVIEFLKPFDKEFETAMLYVSDHGESLGEKGIYLHGLPNWMAPEAQRQVPMVMWVGDHFNGISRQTLQARANDPLSHDHLFHTLLGMFEVRSEVYDPKHDFTRPAK